MAHYLGGVQFTTILLGEAPRPPRQRVEVMTRPGVQGHALRLHGRDGEPFQIVTVSDTATLAAATTLYGNLQALVGQRTSLQWNDISVPVPVDVLDCQAIDGTPRKIVGLVGGLNAPSEGLLICRWTLLAQPT